MIHINLTQFSKDGKNMLRQAFNVYLDNLILDNKSQTADGYYSLFVDDIPHHDKKILLSYLIHIDDYEDFTSNPTREREAIKEYSDEMQYLINQRIDDLYNEIQYDKKNGS